MSEQIPEADAAEQAVAVTDDPADEAAEGLEWPDELPDDADEGDAAEQVRIVRHNEDDYR